MRKAFLIRLLSCSGLVLILMWISFSSIPTSHAAVTLTVCASGCNYTTIAAAITAASDDDTIHILDVVHTEAGISVNKNLTIQGQGISSTIVQAHAVPNAADDRVFTISSGAIVTIQQMTIRHGQPRSQSVSSSPGVQGGGIYNNGMLTLQHAIVTANLALGYPGYGGQQAEGGGIYNNGTLTVTHSSISGNTAQGGYAMGISAPTATGGTARGGGIGNAPNRSLTIIASSISSNTARGGYGVRWRGGQAQGGGIAQINQEGAVTIINSTISNNTAVGGCSGCGPFGEQPPFCSPYFCNNEGRGGGVYGSTGVTLQSATIASNTAVSGGGHPSIVGQGGGVYAGDVDNDNTGPTLENAIIAANSALAGPDIFLRVQSRGYNLIEDISAGTVDPDGNGNTATGNITGQDAKLGSLEGSPAYQPLLFGSPAINAGNPAGCVGSTGPLLTDQRGFPRFGRCDMGAYEAQFSASYLPIIYKN